ncbi:MAG: zinc metalloprotease HtpX [Candidatus Pacebacteria bacterium]|nr:zinc metalloprotease HtpX [Candidatus Paceibacterota bacterium]
MSVATSIMSYWYSDRMVLAMANARPIERRSAPDLYAVVENLAITAGLPVPKIYIINEPAPNAFATGRNPENAVVAVTTGLLERLNRTELEGVIAHELSHIGNWDMLVSTVVVVLVGVISIAGNMAMRSFMWGGMRGRDNRDGAKNGFVALLAIIGVILLPIAATLIQLAISRKREFLADASGALLTRYPEGLASALLKISADPHPVQSASNTTAHLWFENPFKADAVGHGKKGMPWFTKLFLTHPPVAERVAALRGK